MTPEEIATELTKAWVEKVGPKTWVQVAEAYAGILLAVRAAKEDEKAAATRFSALSRAAQVGHDRQEHLSLSQLEAAVAADSGQ